MNICYYHQDKKRGAGPKGRPASASSHSSSGGARGGGRAQPPLAPAPPPEWRGEEAGPKGRPSSASCIGLPIHIPGRRDHYIKGWLQRSPERMVFLWCTCQEHFNPQISGIIHNSIGHQLKLKVILVYLNLCTIIILTLVFLMFIS